MSKKKTNVNKILFYTCPIVATSSLATIGYSVWVINNTESIDNNIDVKCSSLVTNELKFKNVSLKNSSINFDAYSIDNYGSVTASTDSNEQLQILIDGSLSGYNLNFDAIKINFRIQSAFKYKYENLINNGYLEEPKFNELKKTDSTTSNIETNGSYWSSDILSNSRNFKFIYNFKRRSLFNYENPYFLIAQILTE